MNAGQLATRSLKRILVEAAESGLEATEYEDFLASMNDFMADLEAKRIIVGYTPVDNLADEITVPAGAIRGMISNLAIEVAPDFGGYVSPALVKQAKEGMNTLRQIGLELPATSVDPNLPRGSGNDDDEFNSFTHFYQFRNAALLVLAGNTRPTEFPTTFSRVVGFWGVEDLSGYAGDINGRVTHTGKILRNANTKAVLSATGDGDYKFTFAVNGTPLAYSVSATLSATPSDIVLTQLIPLSPGNYLEVWVEHSLSNPCTVIDAEFGIVS